MRYMVEPIVCDYLVIDTYTKEPVCLCNIKENAEIIADVLNADSDRDCSHSYSHYKYAKFKIRR